MSWWLSLLWACSTLDCVLSLWEETPVHFKGAADTQGVSRNKTLTLCLSSFPLSLNRHPFLLCKQTLVIVVVCPAVKWLASLLQICAAVLCRNLLPCTLVLRGACGLSRLCPSLWSFPCGSVGKESACLLCRRPGLDPCAGKIPWRRKWKLQYSCLENPHGQRSPAVCSL